MSDKMFNARRRDPGLGIHFGSTHHIIRHEEDNSGGNLPCLSRSVIGVVRVGVKSKRVMSVVAPAGCTDVHARPFDQTPTISPCTEKSYGRFGLRTFRDETQYTKLGTVAGVDDRMNENLQEPIEHLGLLSALLWRADVIVGREDVFLENVRDGRTGLEHDTVEVINVGIVVAWR